jgi:iron complex outermembrane receptor protein
VATAAVCGTAAASAQSTATDTAVAPATPSAGTIVITGNPLGHEDAAAPANVLTGDELLLQRGSSIGETLQRMPGVGSSYFGPNANRPTIRGQDGDRIRVLSNAGASIDVSALSFDHAVPIDPLVIERLEVLRGPAALLYGGSAVGGVVNAIDNRIPRRAMDGLSGAVELRAGGAADERGGSALLETGNDRFGLHADAFKRRTDDLRVPAFDRPLDGGGSERRTRIVNSASDAEGGSVGGSLLWKDGFAGASIDTYRNTYGTVAEEDVHIRMRRDKLSLAGEWRALPGPLQTVRAQAAYTDYEHQEVAGDGTVGTTFNNRGTDLRVEAVQRPLDLGQGQLEGTWGLQAESARFSALGEEAFVPSTRTRQAALFGLQEWRPSEAWRWKAGVRAERVQVDSAGDTGGVPRFGAPVERSFSPRSASAGGSWQASELWRFSGSVSYTERAPTSYELYAHGLHAATGSIEHGDVDQAKERGRHVELGAAWASHDSALELNLFHSRFARYIALAATGDSETDADGVAHPVYAFEGVRARLYGFELQGHHHLTPGLKLNGQVALTRGDDLTHGRPLPRLAPLKASVGLDWAQGPWGAGAQVEHAARQSRVPADDTPTPSWTMLNANLSWRQPLGEAEALWFLKLQNLGDRLAYNAGTIGTVRWLAPLPGRSVMAGVRLRF